MTLKHRQKLFVTHVSLVDLHARRERGFAGIAAMDRDIESLGIDKGLEQKLADVS